MSICLFTLEYFKLYCKAKTERPSMSSVTKDIVIRTHRVDETLPVPDAVVDGPAVKSNPPTPLYLNPLFWLSVSCLVVAFIATAAMIVLVLMCYRRGTP